jgi:hypothetical protein
MAFIPGWEQPTATCAQKWCAFGTRNRVDMQGSSWSLINCSCLVLSPGSAGCRLYLLVGPQPSRFASFSKALKRSEQFKAPARGSSLCHLPFFSCLELTTKPQLQQFTSLARVGVCDCASQPTSDTSAELTGNALQCVAYKICCWPPVKKWCSKTLTPACMHTLKDMFAL